MTTQYNVDSISKGVNGFGTPFCSQIYTATLKAATDTAIAVPLTAAMGLPAATSFNKFLAVFGYVPAGEYWISVNGTAAAPAGANFALSTSEINPPAKFCKAGDVIHAFCTAGGDISIAFYALLD